MKCKNCNSELNNGASFCTSCGARVEAPVAVPPVIQPAPQPVAPAPKKKGKSPMIIVLIILLCLVLVAGVVVAIYFGLSGSDEDDDDEKSEETAEAEADLEGLVSLIIGDDALHAPNVSTPDTNRGPEATAPYVEETRPEVDTTAEIEEPETEIPETEMPETEAPETEPSEPVWENSARVVIANGGLNMRKSPDRSGAIVNCITNGTIVTVEKVQDNWAYVTYGGKKGWCSCDYLFVPIEESRSPLYKAKVKCSGKIEMISEGYAEDDVVYTDVANGTTVQVYETDGDRAYIKYNNIYGWCESKYLEKI